ADLQPFIASAYADIAPSNNDAQVTYKAGVELEGDLGRDEIAARMMTAMRERRGEEIARGLCLIGPHRDDLVLQLGELPAKGYASHGESWSFALSLRLASFGLLRSDGVEPVLILDDVFAELDEVRRERLAGLVGDAEQVLITAAVASDVPASLDGDRFDVTGSVVSRLTAAEEVPDAGS
ncbi:MAG: DNA replication and repair protein RecF, partial [Micropruina sp.]